MCSLRIFSGAVLARSSISTPPSALASKRCAPVRESALNDTYSSRSWAIACSTRILRTFQSEAKMAWAAVQASSGVCTILTRPALPRPPRRTCALRAAGHPRCSAELTAASTVSASSPCGAGIPNSLNKAFAWYSCSFMVPLCGHLAVGEWVSAWQIGPLVYFPKRFQ